MLSRCWVIQADVIWIGQMLTLIIQMLIIHITQILDIWWEMETWISLGEWNRVLIQGATGSQFSINCFDQEPGPLERGRYWVLTYFVHVIWTLLKGGCPSYSWKYIGIKFQEVSNFIHVEVNWHYPIHVYLC